VTLVDAAVMRVRGGGTFAGAFGSLTASNTLIFAAGTYDISASSFGTNLNLGTGSRFSDFPLVSHGVTRFVFSSDHRCRDACGFIDRRHCAKPVRFWRNIHRAADLRLSGCNLVVHGNDCQLHVRLDLLSSLT
jgi:hypothetical protein